MRLSPRFSSALRRDEAQFFASRWPAVVLFVAFFVFFLGTQSALVPMTGKTQRSAIFGADTLSVRRDMKHLSFKSDMKKHPFFSLTSHPVQFVFRRLPRSDTDRSLLLTAAFFGALNIAGIFLVLKSFCESARVAFAFAVLHAFWFSNFVLFSIPETYFLSTAAILLYFGVLGRVRHDLNARHSAWLSVLAGLASLYNPPLLSLVLVHTLARPMKKDARWLAASGVQIGLAVAVFVVPDYLIQRWDFLPFFNGYSQQWASPRNFANWRYLATVGSDFFFFSLVAPLAVLPQSLGWRDWSQVFSSPLGAILSVSLAAWWVVVIRNARRAAAPLWGSLLAWMLVLALFYVYFNPIEAMLYSSQALVPLTIVFALVFGGLPQPNRVKFAALGAVIVLLATHHLAAFANGMPRGIPAHNDLESYRATLAAVSAHR